MASIEARGSFASTSRAAARMLSRFARASLLGARVV
jgi:hypothetical protein